MRTLRFTLRMIRTAIPGAYEVAGCVIVLILNNVSLGVLLIAGKKGLGNQEQCAIRAPTKAENLHSCDLMQRYLRRCVSYCVVTRLCEEIWESRKQKYPSQCLVFLHGGSNQRSY